MKSVYWSRRRCHLKVFLFFFYLWRPFYLVERIDFSNFGKGSHKEHFCEIIIMKSVHWSRRRCHLKVFLFFFSISGSNFGKESHKQRFKQLWQRVTQETFLWNYYEIGPLVKEGMSFKWFFFVFFLAPAAILFSRAKRF